MKGWLLDTNVLSELNRPRPTSSVVEFVLNTPIDRLEHGADPDALNDNGQAPLTGVAFKGETAIAQLLLEHGAKVDGIGGDHTPLMVAAMFDKADIATPLLEQGADPQARDKAGLCALDLARTMAPRPCPPFWSAAARQSSAAIRAASACAALATRHAACLLRCETRRRDRALPRQRLRFTPLSRQRLRVPAQCF